MAYKKDSEVRGAHPGWAVKFSDGTWLGGAHGWFRSDDAFYADIYDSKEEGEKSLKYLREDRDEKGYFDLPAEVVEAWQPICESLRLEVTTLKQANIVSYMDIFDLREELESIVDKVKEWQEKGKKAHPYSDDDE
jgi:hypothetical protein